MTLLVVSLTLAQSISINNINNSCNKVVQVPKSAESVSPQMINLSQLWYMQKMH